MYFCQKSLEFQENYIKKLEERLSRDGLEKAEICEIVENVKTEKMSNIPNIEDLEAGELW